MNTVYIRKETLGMDNASFPFVSLSDIICSTISFFNQAAVGIDPSAIVLLFGLLLSQPQDVLQPIQSDLNDL